jgi:hypothetical protein
MMIEIDPVQLLFDELKAKVEVSKEASIRYGPQAGITLYEILITLDVNPLIEMNPDRIILSHNGVRFPIWLGAVRTINPRALRSASNCPTICRIVSAAAYCFNLEEEVAKPELKKCTESDALKVFSILNELSKS